MTVQQRGHLAMLLFAGFVAGSFSLGAKVANLIDPLALTWVRLGIGAGFCAILARLLGQGGLAPHIGPRWGARWVPFGAIYVIYFVLMFEGLKTADPVSTSAVFTLQPIMTGLIAFWVLGQVTTRRMLWALAIGAVGALWVIFRADWQALVRFDIGRGEAIYFIGTIFHAALPVLMRRSTHGAPPLVATSLMLGAAFVVLTPLAIRPVLQADWGALSLAAWGIVLYLAVVASGITAMLMTYASQRLPGAKVMAYTYLIPSFVILWQGVMGAGLPSALVAAGVALTILALLLLLKHEPQ